MLPYDKHHYEKAILSFPQQLLQGMELAQAIKVDGHFTSAAICGMGASSLAVELIDALSDTNFPLYAARGYHLPRPTNEQTLVILSSFSGNTEETLSCFAEAKERRLKIVGLSKDGQLEKDCNENKIPFVKYPEQWEGFQPRWGIGYSIAALATILENGGLLKNVVAKIKNSAEQLQPETWRATGKQLAQKLFNKEPAIYGPAKLAYLARFWQMNFNEDAKVPAAWNYFSEVNHYETTGYTQGSTNRVVVILRDPDEHPQIIKRQAITAQLLQEKGVPVEFVDLPHGDTATRLFSGIVISMWTALYLSDLYKIDPAPTEMVEKLKKMLK
jgi:glucose/mannose-6-phosphate isomerase